MTLTATLEALRGTPSLVETTAPERDAMEVDEYGALQDSLLTGAETPSPEPINADENCPNTACCDIFSSPEAAIATRPNSNFRRLLPLKFHKNSYDEVARRAQKQ